LTPKGKYSYIFHRALSTPTTTLGPQVCARLLDAGLTDPRDIAAFFSALLGSLGELLTSRVAAELKQV